LTESFAPDNNKEEGPRRINVDLDNKLAFRFNKIKEKSGLMHDTEVVRMIIQDKYDSLYPNG